MRAGSLVTLAWVALLGAGADESQASEKSPALAFVTGHRIGSNFPDLALSAASQTETYGMLSSALGTAGARQLLQEEIALLVPRYQARWDLNLASVYSQHFSTEELLSLMSDGPGSRYSAKLQSLQPVIGNAMRAASQDLMTQMLQLALLRALSMVAPEPTDPPGGATSF
jgi:hypothetical protein